MALIINTVKCFIFRVCCWFIWFRVFLTNKEEEKHLSLKTRIKPRPSTVMGFVS